MRQVIERDQIFIADEARKCYSVLQIEGLYLRSQFGFRRASAGNDDVRLLMKFRYRIDQHIDALFLAQAIDGQDKRTVGWQLETLARLLIGLTGRVAREIDTIGNGPGGRAQPMLVEQVERGYSGGRHIFAAIAEMHKVAIPDVPERLSQNRVRRERTTNIGGHIMVGRNNRFTKAAAQDLRNIPHHHRRMYMNDFGIKLFQ